MISMRANKIDDNGICVLAENLLLHILSLASVNVANNDIDVAGMKVCVRI